MLMKIIYTALLAFCLFNVQLLNAATRCIAVILYHNIEEGDKSRYNTTPLQLESQLSYLKARGFHSISMQQFMRFIEKKPVLLPEKPVMFQVDDGNASIYHNGWPVFRKYEFRFVNFINPSVIDSRRFLSWSQVIELEKEGNQAENHSYSHKNLTRVNHKKLLSEVNFSRKLMGQKLSRPVDYLAIPFGSLNNRVSKVVKQEHKGAFTSFMGCNKPGGNRYKLLRYTIHQDFKFKNRIKSIEKQMGY